MMMMNGMEKLLLRIGQCHSFSTFLGCSTALLLYSPSRTTKSTAARVAMTCRESHHIKCHSSM